MQILNLCIVATDLQSVKFAVGLQVNPEHAPCKLLLDLPSSGSITASRTRLRPWREKGIAAYASVTAQYSGYELCEASNCSKICLLCACRGASVQGLVCFKLRIFLCTLRYCLKPERERERHYIWGRGRRGSVSPVLKVPRQCPLVLV
jgi:hypothetical protein